jgi:UDP-N-acetyl-2-amino-2-deoxyglucuronate dehydrogenase
VGTLQSDDRKAIFMKQNKFGFGIVGAGMISHFHAKAIHEIPNATLIGVYTHSSEQSADFARQHNCHSFKNLDDLVNSAQIDIVCICTPSGAHLEPTIVSIEAGKHCVVEKPLEVTIERCDEIIRAAQKAAVKVSVIFPSRFHEASRLLKESIENNRFGNLVLGDAYVKWSRTSEYYASKSWRGTWKYDGGGALMNQGIHCVDLLQWFMGPVESVQSITSNIKHKNIEVEDTVVSTLKFRNGALGTIECSTAVFPGALKRIEIMGTDGSAILEEDNLILWQFQDETDQDEVVRNTMSERTISKGGSSNPMDIGFVGHQRQLENMIHSIEVGDQLLIDAVEGRKSVEIILAIYESARLGRTFQLPL